MTSVTGIVKSTANAAIAANSNTPLPAHACTSPRSWGIAPIARHSRPHARNLDVSGTRRRPPHLPLFTCSTPVAYPHHLLAPATTIPPAAIPVIASCTNLRFQLTVTTALLKILAVHKIVLSSPHRDRFSLPFVYHDHIVERVSISVISTLLFTPGRTCLIAPSSIQGESVSRRLNSLLRNCLASRGHSKMELL